MSSKMPQTPPANRSPKGTGDPKQAKSDDVPSKTRSAPDPEKQGDPGNTIINTTNQGHQQDR